MAKILLVDDNEMNRDMLSRRLLRRGFDVVVAVDGLDGLQRARGEVFDVILLDMSLPGMDGWEVARHLKTAPATQAMPVIALTAHAMEADRQRALAAGCDDFDTKPIDFSRLLAKIETFLSIKDN